MITKIFIVISLSIATLGLVGCESMKGIVQVRVYEPGTMPSPHHYHGPAMSGAGGSSLYTEEYQREALRQEERRRREYENAVRAQARRDAQRRYGHR